MAFQPAANTPKCRMITSTGSEKFVHHMWRENARWTFAKQRYCYATSSVTLRLTSQLDSEGVALRFRLLVRKRSYNVRSTNSLWHIDGNHKLIRWNLVILGGIDGFTRIPVYLGCANNNRAETVFGLFIKAVEEYSLRSRVRSDMGGENIDVKRHMEQLPQRGEGRGRIIMGRSVHNQCIERFLRDLFGGCTCLYYNLFYYLENTGVLDPSNTSDIFCLHYIFLPRINQHLCSFVDGWNRHRIRTAGNRTPIQL